MKTFQESRREAIMIMMHCTGSMRQVAKAARLQHGNISQWLKGVPQLSEESVGRLEELLGLENGRPIRGLLYHWHRKAKAEDVIRGLQFVFPKGAKGYTRWVPGIGGSVVQVQAMNLFIGDVLPYVFSDGQYHVFVRRANVRPLVFHAALRRVVDLKTFTGPEMGGAPWSDGNPTLADIRRLPGIEVGASVSDLVAAIEAQGLSIEQAIEKLCA